MDIEEIVREVARETLARMDAEFGAKGGSRKSGAELAHTIEHSVMNPDATREAIIAACREARDGRMANVCVSPYYVSLAAEYLRGSGVKVCTAIGFPHGAATTAGKVAEAREAIQNGAEELDVAMNILAIKNGELKEAQRDLETVAGAARGRALIKAIYEQCLYSDEEKKAALLIARAVCADYVKISNALSGKKASAEDVRFVRSVIGCGMGIKIDGGIADAATVRELMAAGADRFGCSKSVQIISG